MHGNLLLVYVTTDCDIQDRLITTVQLKAIQKRHAHKQQKIYVTHGFSSLVTWFQCEAQCSLVTALTGENSYNNSACDQSPTFVNDLATYAL